MLKLVALVSFVAVYCLAQNVPPFLVNAGQAKQKEFEKMMESASNLNDVEIDRKVQNWIHQQDSGIQASFNKFMDEVKKAQAQAEAAHQAAIARFSPEAKKADAELTAIASDHAIPNQRKGAMINEILQKLSPKVRTEIENAMRGSA